MAGRQGQNKGSKGKPGFQPVVGKGIKPPTTILEMQSIQTNPTPITGEAENRRRQKMPRICVDPSVCGVKVHRVGTVCKAQQLMNKPPFRVDSEGKLFGYKPEKFVELSLGESEMRPRYRSKKKNSLQSTLSKKGLKMPNLLSLWSDGINIDYDVDTNYNIEDGSAYNIIKDVKISVTDSRKVAKHILQSVQHYPKEQDVQALTNFLDAGEISKDGMLDYELDYDEDGESIGSIKIINKVLKEKIAEFLSLSPFNRKLLGDNLKK